MKAPCATLVIVISRGSSLSSAKSRYVKLHKEFGSGYRGADRKLKDRPHPTASAQVASLFHIDKSQGQYVGGMASTKDRPPSFKPDARKFLMYLFKEMGGGRDPWAVISNTK